MRTTQYFLGTLKEAPSDAEVISHKLMLRAGMIRKLTSGIYTWLPLGLRVLRKVEQIVREEMNKAQGIEVLMPAIQPAELWEETNRWDKYGPNLLKIKDRHERDFCFGPTHEEIITDLARRELHSYKQLPIMFYQIQMKFRDEIRPRFGVMRAREFLMKDAYSFHIDQKSFDETYKKMYDTYNAIFTRLGLEFRPVLADTGNIGGSYSHEFQVLAKSGEDLIAYSDSSDYAANIELTEAPVDSDPSKTKAKTIGLKGIDKPYVIVVLRDDHQLNIVKLQKVANVFDDPISYIDVPENDHGIPRIIDKSAESLVKKSAHDVVADIRQVTEGEASPDGKGKLKFARGIEVGQIFQLGDRYSLPMDASITDDKGQKIVMQMGCYGIGVSRVVAAAIEQNNDERGIIWPEAMAPFQVALIGVNANKSAKVKEACEKLYQELLKANIDVLYDDRDERPGVMFADMELIGIPHRIVIGEKSLQENCVEYQGRRDKESKRILQDEIIKFISG